MFDRALFDEIYQAASQQNARALGKLASDASVNLDTLDPSDDMFTPAAKLAAAGREQEVNRLLEYADVNRLAIIFGYAFGGHREMLERFLARYVADLDEQELVKHALLGFAPYGDKEAVDRLESIEPGSSGLERQERADLAVYAYGINGHIAAIKQQLAGGASVNQAVRGLARGGYAHAIQPFVQQGAEPIHVLLGFEECGKLPFEVVKALSVGERDRISRDDIDKATALLAQAGYTIDKMKVVLGAEINTETVMVGYIQGGHLTLANLEEATQDSFNRIVRELAGLGCSYGEISELLKGKEVVPAQVLIGYAEHGQLKQLADFIQEVEKQYPGSDWVDWAVQGLVLGGYKAAVNQYIAEGANIPRAAYAYAQIGDVSEVNKLLSRDPSALELAIQGYASVGNESQINKFLQERISEHEQLQRLGWAIQGYAQCGNESAVTALLTTLEEREVGAYIGMVARAVSRFAQAGYYDAVEQLVARGENRKEILLNWAIYGAALSGDREAVERFLARVPKHGMKEALNWAVEGCAQSGFVEGVDFLLQRGARKTMAGRGYARGGFVSEAEHMILLGADLYEVVQGFIKSRLQYHVF